MTGTSQIRYEPLREGHVRSAAEFHRRFLAGQLSEMGLRAIERFYGGALTLKGSRGWLAWSDTQIVGLVFGHLGGSALTSDLVRKDPSQWAFEYLFFLFHHPLLALKLLLQVFGTTSREQLPVELQFLAVHSDFRGKGIGKELLRRFKADIKCSGNIRFQLMALKENADTNLFYQSQGARLIGVQSMPDGLYNRYEFGVEEGVH